MSKEAIAALSEKAKGVAPADDRTPAQRARAVLAEHVAAGGPKAKQPSMLMAPVGGAELLLKGATGAIASIPAGVAYGGAALGRALGLDADPRAAMRDVMHSLTYQPVSDSARAGEQQLGDIGRSIGDVLDVPETVQAADELVREIGRSSPTAETYLREAPAAFGAAGGAMGLSPFVAPATQIVRSVPQAAAAAGRATLQGARAIKRGGEAVSDTVVRAAGGEVRPPADLRGAAAVSDALTGFGADTASAAAASRINAAKNISPELRADLHAKLQREGALHGESVDRQIDADALPIRMRLMEGQASKDPEVWSREFNAKGKDPDTAAKFNEQNQQLIDNLDEFRREAAPQAVAHDPVQSGQNLVDAYKRMDEVENTGIAADYKAARDANGGDLPMDGQAFTASADAALKKNMKARYLPAEIAADVADIRESGMMTFETFENMRTNLAAAGRKAERAGDGNATAAINIVRDALENVEPVGRVAEVKPLFDQARARARARFDRLRADPAYKAAVNDDVGPGEASPLADKFVSKYIVGAPRAHVGRMIETLGADELAMETVRAAPFNHMKAKAGIDPYRNEGNFSQHGYNRALAELTPKLDLMVGEELAEQAQRLGRVAYDVKSEPAGSFPNRSNTFIAASAEAAKGLAERSANTLLGGNIIEVGTWAREKLDARTAAREKRERFRPAAGTSAKPKKDKP